MPLKIAITGALGLLGSGITTAALSSGHSVLALDIREDGEMLNGFGETTQEDIDIRQRAIDAVKDKEGQFTYKKVDLMDYERTKEVIREAGCDALIHLAAVYAKKDADGNYLAGPGQETIHNMNTTMSYNTMLIAAELGIKRMVTASSVNSIGMVFSRQPRFDYLPLDESHPFYPEDAYSLSKYIAEIQADSITRRHPIRIASFRFHWVVPHPFNSRELLHQRGGNPKDLWGFVSISGASDACLKALTSEGWEGHETFFIVAKTTCQQESSRELAEKRYPGVEWRRDVSGNEALIDTSKAEELLGWKDEGYPWDG